FDFNRIGLWGSDGTRAGTKLLKYIQKGPKRSFPRSLFRFGNEVLFQARADRDGAELWITDRTSGTELLADIRPGSRNSFPRGMIEFGGKVHFQADDGTQGAELWVTDRTPLGTRMLVDILEGSSGSSPLYFAELGGKLYFRATGPTNGTELWMTDGTASGTKEAVDIRTGALSGFPEFITAVGSRRLYFSAWGGAKTGNELWVSDGTKAGTRRLGDMNPGTKVFAPGNVIGRNRSRFAVLNDQLYFRGWDDRGSELWSFKNGATAHPIHEGCRTGLVSMRATDPVLGSTLEVTGSTGVTRPIVLLPIGFRSGLAATAGNACLSYLDFNLPVRILMATGSRSWSFRSPIPNDRSLSGATLPIQAWTFPPSLSHRSIELSNAVTLTLGG
ncbi:MAG: hypothetical protein ACE5F1_22980, partial [Planctomycetota bacterium]